MDNSIYTGNLTNRKKRILKGYLFNTLDSWEYKWGKAPTPEDFINYVEQQLQKKIIAKVTIFPTTITPITNKHGIKFIESKTVVHVVFDNGKFVATHSITAADGGGMWFTGREVEWVS